MEAEKKFEWTVSNKDEHLFPFFPIIAARSA